MSLMMVIVIDVLADPRPQSYLNVKKFKVCRMQSFDTADIWTC